MSGGEKSRHARELQLLAIVSAALVCVLLTPVGRAWAEPEAKTLTGQVPAQLTTVESGSDSDELMAGYIEQQFSEPLGTGQLNLMASSAYLGGNEQRLYDALLPFVREVASGERTSTRFDVPVEDIFGQSSWTADDLGVEAIMEGDNVSTDAEAAFNDATSVDLGLVFSKLQADLPYELYWSGRSFGFAEYGYAMDDSSIFIPDDTITVLMNVASDYANQDGASEVDEAGRVLYYETDPSYGIRVNNAVQNAITIAAGQETADLQMTLVNFKDTICDLVSYDDAAAEESDPTFADPWQLVSVFDGDTDTNVVCEGYSKAFKYLCDLSDIADGRCILASGTMSGGTGAGNHMWNIVEMDDGRSYLVDVTNCDEGTVGEPDQLFLAPYTDMLGDSYEDGYGFEADSSIIEYVYDQDTLGIFDGSALTISDLPYGGEDPDGDIASIELKPQSDIQFDQGKNGGISYSTDDEGVPIEGTAYFNYDDSDILKNGDVLTVTFADGSTKDYFFDENDEYDYAIAFKNDEGGTLGELGEVWSETDQRSDRPWSPDNPGTLTIHLDNLETSVPIEIVPNGVQSIAYIPKDGSSALEVLEGTNTYGKSDSFGDWFGFEESYVTAFGDVLKVTYTNGESEDFVYDKGYFDSGENQIDFSDVQFVGNQAFNNQWAVDNPGTLYVCYAGAIATVPVEVIENPLEGISFVPATPYELVEGFDSAGQYNEEEGLYWYSAPSFSAGDTLVVTWKDAAQDSKTYVWEYDDDAGCGIFRSDDGDEIEEYLVRWDPYDYEFAPGEHSFQLTYSGRSCEVPVSILPNPIQEISYQPAANIELMQGVDEWEETGEDGDGNEVTWSRYRYEEKLPQLGDVLTVALTDGSVVDYTYQTIDGSGEGPVNGAAFQSPFGDIITKWSISFYDDQSYDNQWEIGEHLVRIEYAERSCGIPVNVVPNTITSIAYVPADRILVYDQINGAEINGEWYLSEDPEFGNGDELILTLDDGSTKTYRYDQSDRQFACVDDQADTIDGYRVELNIDKEAPLVFGNNAAAAEVSFAGHSCNVDVTLEENPIDTIEFVPVRPVIFVEGEDDSTEYDDEGNAYQGYRYELNESGDSIRVRYKGGDEFDYYCYAYDSGGYVFMSYDSAAPVSQLFAGTDLPESNQSANSPWGPGDHAFTLTIAGKVVEIPVEVRTSGSSRVISLDDVTFEDIKPQHYTGFEVWPEIVATYKGARLYSGEAFDYVCKNNVEVGEATVTLTGIGDYEGEVVKTFQIVKDYRIVDGVVTFDDPDMPHAYLLSTDPTESEFYTMGPVYGGELDRETFVIQGEDGNTEYYLWPDSSSNLYLDPVMGKRITAMWLEPAGAGELTWPGGESAVTHISLNAPATIHVTLEDVNYVTVASDAVTGAELKVPEGYENRFQNISFTITRVDDESDRAIGIINGTLAASGDSNTVEEAVVYDISVVDQDGNEVYMYDLLGGAGALLTLPVEDGWDSEKTGVYGIWDDSAAFYASKIDEGKATLRFNDSGRYAVALRGETSSELQMDAEGIVDKMSVGDSVTVRPQIKFVPALADDEEGQEQGYSVPTKVDYSWIDYDEGILRVVNNGDGTYSIEALSEGETSLTLAADWQYKTWDPEYSEVVYQITVGECNHQLEKVPRVEPTLEKEGNIEHWKCSKCGNLYTDAEGTQLIAAEDVVIPKLIDLSAAQIELEDDICTYDGTEQKPAIVAVALGDKMLEEGVDYTVSYSNNTDPTDKAKVTVTGIGLYGGEAAKTFKIKKSLAGAIVEAKEQLYSGAAQTPELTVTLDGKQLGTEDYVVGEIRDNVNAGTAYVLVKGIGDYEGSTAEGSFTISKRSVTLVSKSLTKKYDGTPLTDASVTIDGDGFVEGEVTDLKATGSVKDVSEGEVANVITFTPAAGFVEGNYDIQYREGKLSIQPTTVLVTADDTSKAYGDDDPEFTATVDGLVGDDTVEYEFSRAQGEAVGSYGLMPTGEINQGNYQVSFAGGTLSITPRELVIETSSAEKGYDGLALTSRGATVSGLVGNDAVTVTTTGTQTEVGSSDNGYVIDWGTTKRSNYSLTEVLGTLTVTKNAGKVTIAAGSDSKSYDGTPLVKDSFGVTGLPTGFEATASVEGAQVNAGASANRVKSYKIINAAGQDKTDCFSNVELVDGLLSVTKRKVTFTSGSASMEYDGTTLTSGDVYVSGEGFVDGEGATFTTTGAQTVVGSSANTFSYTFNDGTDASNYEVTIVEGTLTVTSRDAKYEIVATANSATYDYDGTAKSAGGLITTSFTVDGNDYTLSGITAQTVTATDAGTYTVAVSGTPVVLNAEGDNVTSEFSITTKNGTLTINPIAATITTGSGSKAYDGAALTLSDASVSGLASGDTVTITATGTQTEVGSSTNGYDLVWSGANEQNYVLSEELGTLTVTTNDKPITITAASASKTFDGTALVAESAFADGLPDTVELVATVEGSQLNAGSSENKLVSYVIRDASGADKTANFTNLTTANGTLTVNKKNLSDTDVTIDRISRQVYEGSPVRPMPVVKIGSKALVPGTDFEVSYQNNDKAGTASLTVTGAGNYEGSKSATFAIVGEVTDLSGIYEIRSVKEESSALDVTSGSRDDGARIQLYTANDTKAQRFRFDYDEDKGTYTITNVNSGKVLSVSGGAANRGAIVDQESPNGSLAQQWIVCEQEDGSVVIMSALDSDVESGLVLDLQNGSTANGTKLQTWTANNSPAQAFKLIPHKPLVPDGIYQLTSVADSRYVLDVANGSVENGGNVQSYWNNGSLAQWWQITYDPSTGYYKVISVNSGLALDVADGKNVNSANIQQYSYNGTDAQLWSIEQNRDGGFALRSATGGRAVDVSGGIPTSGENVQLYNANGTAAQGWNFEGPSVSLSFTHGSHRLDPDCAVDVSLDTSSFAKFGWDVELEAASVGGDGWVALDSTKVTSATTTFTLKGTAVVEALGTDSGEVLLRAKADTRGQYDQALEATSVLTLDKGMGHHLTKVAAQEPTIMADGNIEHWRCERCGMLFADEGGKQELEADDVTRTLDELIVPDGVYTIVSGKAGSLAIDINGGSTANAAKVQLYYDNATKAQRFRFTYSKEKGTYTIINVNSGLAFDVENGSRQYGAAIQQYYANGSLAQQWKLYDAGDGRVFIASALKTDDGRRLVLDIPSGNASSGQQLQTYLANGSAAQIWNLRSCETVEEGTYAIASSVDERYVLDVAGGSTANSANVQLYWNNGSDAQRWKVSYDASSGYYTILNVGSGRSLDVDGGKNANGANVQQYTPNNTDAQLWDIIDNGSGGFVLRSSTGGRAIDVDNGIAANGRNIQIWNANGSEAQAWVMKPID